MTLSPEAHARVEQILRTASVELVHWPVEDATQVGGSRELRIEAYRRVREIIDRRIREEIGARVL